MFQCLASQRPEWAFSHLKEFVPELRAQLNEQLRSLDVRVEVQCALAAELQEWFRRRAELHQDYSARLEKFSKSLMARHKEQKAKRESWNLFSLYNCWQVLLSQTKKDARDHAAMAEVYLSNIVPRFTQIQDDVQRIYKKCRDVCYESHEELLKVLHELHTTMRTYHEYQGEFKNAEAKLQNLEAQKAKLEQTTSREKLGKRKKFRVIEKEIEKRRSKYRDAKLKALKARNDYILFVDSANASIHKYFVEDLSDVIDCMDLGFHSSIAKALMAHVSGQECFKRTLQNGIDDVNRAKTNMDSRLDKQRFLEFHNAAFMLPKKFDFQSYKGDEVNHVLVSYPIQEETEQRYARLVSRLTNLKTELEETWKTIETAERTLMSSIGARDYDIAHFFADEPPRIEAKTPEVLLFKRKADHLETEAFYLDKFRDYTLGNNLVCRLQARFELLRKALGNETQAISSPTPTRNLNSKPRRRRIGRTPLMGQPRLFGGSLEEYLEATGQEIPLIVKSCVRIINLYGLHHQGIFRVSGSQVEINNFRETFEKMEDPLADVSDASDINSIAGVLKLYLRELREPLFPTVYFEQFMEIAQLESKQDFVNSVREVVTSLPRSVFVVMRYLFGFLNHLSEFSDENMMDPYNLAICFGPTLVPIPEDKDQVQYQNLVNELIKNIIIFYEEIFPRDFGGPAYEKYISRDSIEFDADMAEAPADDADGHEFDPNQSEDDAEFKDPLALQVFGKNEVLEAVAQFDFKARSGRELSFGKGDVLLLQSQASADWWKGSFNGKLGLIPDKYILLKIRDEDKERCLERGGSSSADSGKRRASSSSESNPGPLGLADTLPVASVSPDPTSWTGPQERAKSECASETESSPMSSLISAESDAPSSAGGDAPESRPSSAEPHRKVGSFQTPSPQEFAQKENVFVLTPVSLNEKEQQANGHTVAKDDQIYQPSSDSVSSLPSSGFHSTGRCSDASSRLCASLSETSQFSDFSGNVTENWRVNIRPVSEDSLSRISMEEKSLGLTNLNFESLKRSSPPTKPVSDTPDLVMDLPVHSPSSSSSSPKLPPPSQRSPLGRDPADESSDCSSGSNSPENGSSMTAAECFAKQHQSTLKKGSHHFNRSSSSSVSTDAQTQTHTAPAIYQTTPLKGDSDGDSVPSVTTIVKNLDSVMQRIKAEQQQQQSAATEVSVEVRAAADMCTADSASVPRSPSTPKLADRYLKAVVASGGGAGVAVKPQIRVKPAVTKKPSLPAQLSSCAAVASDKQPPASCSNPRNSS